MRKLKIAFLSGGNFVHINSYLQFFKQQGHQVSLIAYEKPAKDFQVPVYDISHGANCWLPLTKWKYLWAACSLRKLITRLSPDILHGHYVTSAGMICMLSGFRPYVLTVHGSDLICSMRSLFWKQMLRKVFARAALVNTVSDELTFLAQKLGVPRSKILTACPGVDTRVFDYRPSVGLSSPVKLLCTRTLGKVYDPPTIIEACEILKDKNVPFKLTFAAGGPLLNQLRSIVNEKKLSQQIVFMGGYDNAALPELLHRHDIYISASKWDGTSLSLLEAMSCGIFPVVSRVTSNQAWCDEGKNSLMFEPGQANQLASAVIRAVSNHELRQEALRHNRQTVEDKADREKNMLELEKRYYEIKGF